MVQIEVLPAAHGDALWIEYGSASQLHRILIDGGPANAYQHGLRHRIEKQGESDRAFELMLVTHIDADHIDGALILLQELQALKIDIAEFWFNGWNQLPQQDARAGYGPLQGEYLGGLINESLKDVWNKRFDNKAVVIADSGLLPKVQLSGGAQLTLLGPTDDALRRLRGRWVSAIRDFSPGDANEALRRLLQGRRYEPPPTPDIFAGPQFGTDRTVANGSSISFVLEYEGVSLLLAADAHARTLASSLERLARERSTPKLRFDAVKLPHHGSKNNISEAWLQWIDCPRWLISTNGELYDHPHVETAQLIAAQNPEHKPVLLCNYRSPSTLRLETQPDSHKWITVLPKQEPSMDGVGLVLRFPEKDEDADKRAARNRGAKRNIARKPTKPRKTGGAR